MRRIAVPAAWLALALLLAGCGQVQVQPSPAAGATVTPRGPWVPPPTRPVHHHRGVPRSAVPDPALTPGTRFVVGVGEICRPGYASSVRDVTEADKAAVYARYGVTWVPYQHEVDHLISLELGGSNAIRNLWPEPYAGRWGARTKDVLENRLHELVCAGKLSLHVAQRQEATDWVGAYLRYVGRPPKASDDAGSTSPGGYYASSYPSASTIYCANDPEWHALSSEYRVDFATFEEAIVRFPHYHLHQPC